MFLLQPLGDGHPCLGTWGSKAPFLDSPRQGVQNVKFEAINVHLLRPFAP